MKPQRKATPRKKTPVAPLSARRTKPGAGAAPRAARAKRSKPSGDDRLQKILAMSGYGSRRQCEELITEGRVEIDRQVAAELGVRVDPEKQQVRVDGVVVKLPRFKYFLLHKPVGVISTAKDPWARTRVIDLVADSDRLFTVGRLDVSSSGLILVTNDGDLAHQLTHPSFQVDKVYRVIVAGSPTSETLRQLREGVYLAEGKARVEKIIVRKAHATSSELEIVLSEGRNREIRRLLARFGHKVQRLKRLALGPIRLGELPVGAYRELSRQEVQALRRIAKAGAEAAVNTPSRSPRKSPSDAKIPRDADSGSSRDAAAKKPRAGRPGPAGTPARAKGGKLKATPRSSGATVWPADTSAKSRAGRSRVIGTVLGSESVENEALMGEDEMRIRRPTRGSRAADASGTAARGPQAGGRARRQGQGPSSRPAKGQTGRRSAQAGSGAAKKKSGGRRGGKQG